MHGDGRGVAVAESPHLFQELLPPERPPGMLHEVGQQVELLGRQRHQLPAEPGLVGGDVDLQLTGPEHRRPSPGRRRQRAARPAQHRLHPGGELPGRERLGHVVVGAELEADDAVGLLAEGGEDDDGDGRRRPDPFAHLEAAEAGQHQVEHHQLRRVRQRPVEPGGAVGGDLDLEALPGQVAPDDLGHGGVVFDNEHAGGHRRSIHHGSDDRQPGRRCPPAPGVVHRIVRTSAAICKRGPDTTVPCPT